MGGGTLTSLVLLLLEWIYTQVVRYMHVDIETTQRRIQYDQDLVQLHVVFNSEQLFSMYLT